MVTAAPASSPGQALVAAALGASVPWPDRIAWAQKQRPVPGEVVEDRLVGWRAAVDPGDVGQFQRRLELGGLSTDAAHVVVSHIGDLAPSQTDWLGYFLDFHSACTAHEQSEDSGDDACLRWLVAREAGWPSSTASMPFAHLLWPGVLAAWARLEREHSGLLAQVAPRAADGLRLGLLARVSELMAPTLVQDMAAGLTYGQRLLARIGDEPTDAPRLAYARTCRAFAAGGLDRVLLAHPVLPSLTGTVIRQWRAATVEMLERIDRHRLILRDELGVDPHAPLTAAALTAGDRHNDGRSVAILAFGGTRVVYKPRDSRLERLWLDLVTLLNEKLPVPGLRAARMVLAVDGTDQHYGFAEFVDNTACSDEDESEEFYVNAGRTLALLHALSATDCHQENLIALGGQLVLVDAEALFETRGNRMRAHEVDEESGLSTVLQVGMLPAWMWLEAERTALDVSALGCPPGGTVRSTSRGWRAVNTDAMTRGMVSVPLPHPVSLPTPDGTSADLPAHVEELVHGFEEGYRAISAARSGGFVDAVRGASQLSRRLIQRPTYVYAALLGRSREPEALRGAVARGMILEELTRAYLTPQAERLWPLMVAEQQAIARLDVPLFEATIDGTRTRCIDSTVTNWPGVNALTEVLLRISRMNEQDLAWQTRLIRASITAHEFLVPRAEDGTPPRAPRSHVTARSMAQRCRRRIVVDALHPVRDATWMTLGLLPDGEHVNVQPVGSGLYDGALGLAVFLYNSGEHGLGESAIGPLLAELDPDDPARARRQVLAGGSGLSGAGGYLRALRLLGRRHLDGPVADRAIAATIRATAVPSLARDHHLDLLNGAAGIITPLAAERSARHLGEADLERAGLLVRAAADRLVAQQRPDGGWRTLPRSGPLTGLAHGVSGIAVALVEAAICLDEPRYLEAAMRGLAYEDGLFDVDAGNWPDLRTTASGGFMMGWCAGAPGIALARMRLIDRLPGHPLTDRWWTHLETAAATTGAAALLARDHLCCGNLGRAVILRTLGHRFGEPQWLAQSDDIVDQVLSRAGDGMPRGFLGAEADVLSVPGLMTGQAGAGLSLRCDDPSPWVTALLV